MIFTVYRHENKINGKSYVGQTCQVPPKRWQNGTGYNKQPKFLGAIKKYGWNGFEHHILAICESEEDAIKIETFFKKCFDSVKNGYNCVLEDDRVPNLGLKFSEEHRKKISASKRGVPVPEERKKRISATLMGHPSSHNGKKIHTEESKRKISEANKGKHYSLDTEFKAGEHFSPSTEFKAGQPSHNKKFTLQQEKEIEEKWLNGRSQNSLSKEYNVTRGPISRIIKSMLGLQGHVDRKPQ